MTAPSDLEAATKLPLGERAERARAGDTDTKRSARRQQGGPLHDVGRGPTLRLRRQFRRVLKQPDGFTYTTPSTRPLPSLSDQDTERCFGRAATLEQVGGEVEIDV